MRATRAYLAGFGTSGSLLAGVALMFVLASAIIAFRGWPQVANPFSPVSVSVPRVNAAAGSRASRVLVSGAAAHSLRAGGAAGALRSAGGARLGGGRGLAGFGSGSGPAGSDTTLGSPTAHDVPGAGTPARHCTSSCTQPGGPVPTVVSKTISSASSTAKSTVGTVKKTVKKVLPHGTGSAGSAVSGAVSGATHGVSNSLP